MRNVEVKVEGQFLTLKIDLSKGFGPSKSGKTIMIASTDGPAALPEPFRKVKVGLNVYKGQE